MKKKIHKTAKWVSISILFVLFLILAIHLTSDRTPNSKVEYRTGIMDQVMVGYIKDGKTIVHSPSFFKNDSILLKNIAGTDPNSKDSVYISPFMEILNGAAPLIGWAFPKWELVMDRFSIRKGKKYNSMSMITLVKSQGYFYLQIIRDKEAFKRKVRIATADQLPSCAIK